MIVGHVMLDGTIEMKRILFGRLSHTFEFHTGHQPSKNNKGKFREYLKPSPKWTRSNENGRSLYNKKNQNGNPEMDVSTDTKLTVYKTYNKNTTKVDGT